MPGVKALGLGGRESFESWHIVNDVLGNPHLSALLTEGKVFPVKSYTILRNLLSQTRGSRL